MQNAKWQKNIFRLYGFSFFQAFLVAIPVIVPFWQDLGLSIQEIFLLQSIFGITLLIFDVPAGYLADLFGRKKALVIGSFITAIGFQFLWRGKSFLDFAIYEVILGIGLSLQSGCDVAILYSTLEHLKLEGRKSKFLGRRLLSMQIGEAIASLAGGLLALLSLQLPMIINAVTAFGSVVFALQLHDGEERKLLRTSHFENFKLIGKALFGHSKLLTLLILSNVFYSFATYCAVWTLQPYWKQMNLNYSIYGLLWSFNCLLTGVIGHWAHKIEIKIGSVKTILIVAIAPIVGYLGMGVLGGWLGLAFMIFFPLCRGLNSVLFQDAVNARVPAEIRATTNSISSLGMRMLFFAFGPLLGKAIDVQGPQQSMIWMGCIYLGGFFVIALPLLGQRQHFVQD